MAPDIRVRGRKLFQKDTAVLAASFRVGFVGRRRKTSLFSCRAAALPVGRCWMKDLFDKAILSEIVSHDYKLTK
jgi:hypothetical protein